MSQKEHNMAKRLGLDLGTNSIGWALVEIKDGIYTPIDKGVDIFQEGVAREKGNEKPAVQDRTAARALRRLYFRRRLRKVELLKCLVRYNLCPSLTENQLADWKQKKVYPMVEEFILWQRTDDNTNKNPYYDRYRALTETLNLTTMAGRYTLGRALYHICQRRGFLSNRKEAGGDDNGKVKQGISDLTKDMETAGCQYLGEYFYRLYGRKEKIRLHYTARNEHYLAEFNAICNRQNLPDEWRKALRRAIFYQRPLRSQKGLVGHCTFERKKARCPLSHPRFEEYRMLCFLNNIRVQGSDDIEPRPLTNEERKKVNPLFFRKNKEHFNFEEIARKIAGKGNYVCKGDASQGDYRFNYAGTATVTGCPVTAHLRDLFGGETWLDEVCSVYTLSDDKTEEQVLNDVWHALFSFDNEVCLQHWAKEKLQLPPDEAKAFAQIRMSQGYAELSLNVINKMLPYLREGYRYDEAVFLANLKAVVPAAMWTDEEQRGHIVADVAEIVTDFARNPLNKGLTKEQCIADYLQDTFYVDRRRIEHLYHPSMIKPYPQAKPNEQGELQLGSPRTSSVRNPVAMRALFRLRALLNRLLREGKIDSETIVNIEFSRGLNDANRRKAIEQYQRNRERERQKYADEIRELYEKCTGRTIEPSEEDLLKYQLWEEQNHLCIYTGQQISITDFIGSAPRFDIEHTVPRSRGGDDSQMNKTLCENRFNRESKRTCLPAELANHREVMIRVEELGWAKRIKDLQGQIERQKRVAKSAATKEIKDNAIQKRHCLQMSLDYWRGKYERFTMTEVPEGFSNRQGVDIGIIGKYARLYLKTVFNKIYSVKGATTAEFRRMWGLQDAYAKKERVNHIHHCIDAMVIACIGKAEYDRWAQYKVQEENYQLGVAQRPVFEKPWQTFTEDVKAFAGEVLVAHHTPDNMPKQTRKKLRVRGEVQYNKDGKPIYMQGDSARGVLHQQTFYGAIRCDEEIKYVVRKSLGKLKQEDVDKIVDDVVRSKVKEAVDKVGFKQAMDENYIIWMSEEKRVPIRKVRIYTPGVTKPIHLKKQRNLSVKTYKQDYHVANDSNYCMAIYEGRDQRDKLKRSFKLVSNFEAAQYFKQSTDKNGVAELVSQSDAMDYPLNWILKVGTMVLFYENSANELYESSKEELVKRLYKVTGLSSLTVNGYHYGSIVLRHHQEARKATVLKAKNGGWKEGEEYRPIIALYHTQLKAFVEGYDFELTVTGEIVFKH